MKKTGIFFTYFQGERLKDFPEALDGLLEKENVLFYDAVYSTHDGLYYLKPLPETLLLKVHSRQMVEGVKESGDYEGAMYSVAGTVLAAEEIHRGNIDNAFIFTSFGDHHAGRNFYGGMCYFTFAAVAIALLREKGVNRFAIVDTDIHHADGTRDIFRKDAEVLHVCFCYQDYEDNYNKIDVNIPYRTTDEEYLEKMIGFFVPQVKMFQPEYIFWEFGYDATIGDYGDKGISRDCHIEMAKIIKKTADEVCNGRLITILCGGSRRDIAAYTIPKIISVLAAQ